jgi:hypothetical protein
MYFHMNRKFTIYVTLDASKILIFQEQNIIPIISKVSIHLV